jgi:hypothetical protein
MNVIGFLCVSLGSSIAQLHKRLGSRRACVCSVAGFSSHNDDLREAFCCTFFLWAKGLNAKDIDKEMFPRKADHSWVRDSLSYARPGAEVAETTVKRFLCCGFRRAGKAMGQVYQCWWRICREVNVFSRFEYHMFYVLYPFFLVSRDGLWATLSLPENEDEIPRALNFTCWNSGWYCELGWGSDTSVCGPQRGLFMLRSGFILTATPLNACFQFFQTISVCCVIFTHSDSFPSFPATCSRVKCDGGVFWAVKCLSVAFSALRSCRSLCGAPLPILTELLVHADPLFRVITSICRGGTVCCSIISAKRFTYHVPTTWYTYLPLEFSLYLAVTHTI